MENLVIYTDGSCKRHGEAIIGTYGYAYRILTEGKKVCDLDPFDQKLIIEGGVLNNTCIHKLEMEAVIKALERTKTNMALLADKIIIATDSRLTIRAIELNSTFLELKNFFENKKIEIEFIKVKAHSSNNVNQLIDRFVKKLRMKEEGRLEEWTFLTLQGI